MSWKDATGRCRCSGSATVLHLRTPVSPADVVKGEEKSHESAGDAEGRAHMEADVDDRLSSSKKPCGFPWFFLMNFLRFLLFLRTVLVGREGIIR